MIDWFCAAQASRWCQGLKAGLKAGLSTGLVAGLLLVGLLGCGRFGSVAIAATATQQPLTLSILDQRIAAPVQKGATTVIDLSDFTINLRETDLSGKNSSSDQTRAFSKQFYERLQQALNPKKQSGSQPIGIDFSGTLIQGDLAFSRLSLRVPAYGDAMLPALETFKQTLDPALTQSASVKSPFTYPAFASSQNSLYTSAYFLPYSARLSRFLLTSPQRLQPDTLVFRGPLLLSQTCFNGTVNANDIYFLSRVEAPGVIFTQAAQWQGAKFARSVNFSNGQFQQESSFRTALFAKPAQFNQTRFSAYSNWQGSLFHDSASFAQADFQAVTFARAHWQANADFDRAQFHTLTNFQKTHFDQALFLTDALLEGTIGFRQAQFQQSISLRGAHVITQVDFGDARFAKARAGSPRSGNPRADSPKTRRTPSAKAVTINVADLDFSAGEARILGSPGQIGRVLSVPTLTGNETVLRNLVRNFRLLEQIGDANQVEYSLERLRLAQLKQLLLGTSLNRASAQKLTKLGFSAQQAAAIVARADAQPFVSRSDLLSVDEVDLATYLQLRDRITTGPNALFNRLQRLCQWLLLAGLLQLSNYGTNVNLIFSVGILAVTLFGFMFWLIDRFRRLTPTPIVPSRAESIVMITGGSSLIVLGLSLLSQSCDQPISTLAAVGLLTLPIPGALLVKLYREGRYHDLMDDSYFVQNGALRELQVLIARLPILPKFPFYRERYSPLPCDRSWNWLNYFDFSLNNWFKFGFNDIRLRDSCVPGVVSILVWYQWSLGLVYITLLLWTLSRTIPGLNLLLYF